jgi:hypothetical protein
MQDTANVKTSKPVTSDQWRSIAKLGNHLNGVGGTLIPAHAWFNCYTYEGYFYDIALSDAKTFRYWIYPRKATHTRLWIFRFASTDTTDGGLHSHNMFKGTIEINGDADVVQFQSNNTHNNTVTIVKHVYTPSNTPVEQTVEITNTGTAAPYTPLIVEQISCYEMPRNYLYDGEASMEFADEPSCKREEFIRDEAGFSVRGCFGAVARAKDEVRRNMISYSNPNGRDLSVANFATYAHMLLNTNINPEGLGRYLTSSTINEQWRCNIYAKVSSGTAHVKITPSYTGASSYVMTFTNTTAAWYSATAGLLIKTRAEDLTSTDGRRNSVWSTLKFEAKTDTATHLYIYHISVGERNGD